jgi:hypothetical protein
MVNPVIIREWFAVIDLSISCRFKDLLELKYMLWWWQTAGIYIIYRDTKVHLTYEPDYVMQCLMLPTLRKKTSLYDGESVNRSQFDVKQL